jgi:hypothetical protein
MPGGPSRSQPWSRARGGPPRPGGRARAALGCTGAGARPRPPLRWIRGRGRALAWRIAEEPAVEPRLRRTAEAGRSGTRRAGMHGCWGQTAPAPAPDPKPRPRPCLEDRRGASRGAAPEEDRRGRAAGHAPRRDARVLGPDHACPCAGSEAEAAPLPGGRAVLCSCPRGGRAGLPARAGWRGRILLTSVHMQSLGSPSRFGLPPPKLPAFSPFPVAPRDASRDSRVRPPDVYKLVLQMPLPPIVIHPLPLPRTTFLGRHQGASARERAGGSYGPWRSTSRPVQPLLTVSARCPSLSHLVGAPPSLGACFLPMVWI